VTQTIVSASVVGQTGLSASLALNMSYGTSRQSPQFARACCKAPQHAASAIRAQEFAVPSKIKPKPTATCGVSGRFVFHMKFRFAEAHSSGVKKLLLSGGTPKPDHGALFQKTGNADRPRRRRRDLQRSSFQIDFKWELASLFSRVPSDHGQVVWHPEKSIQDAPLWVTRQSKQVSVLRLGRPVQVELSR
jgi:hypothetical protein